MNISMFAQQGALKFQKKEINLKNLKADNVPTTVNFTFKNIGTQPVIITRVSPISSQIKAEWDKAPITPGTTSAIKVSFTSANMPENFDYVINVALNTQNDREQLRLSANIVDNPAKPELLYKNDCEGVKFKSTMASFNNIYAGQVVADTFWFFNSRTDDAVVTAKYIPQHITMKTIPDKTAPGKKGMLILTFDSQKKNDYGYIYDNVILAVNNSNNYNNRLTITATIVEDFRKLSASELANAPVAFIEKKDIEFGSIKPGEKANCDFILENKGKSNLIIRKTKASCGCTAITMGESTIAPGKSMTIRATFDSTGKNGRQNKSVTVITNDPKTPEINLNISGTISQ